MPLQCLKMARGILTAALICLNFCALPAFPARTNPSGKSTSSAQSQIEIPPGTILPARLNQTLSTARVKSGQVVTARLMQDVPLPRGQRIPAGSTISGKVAQIQTATGGASRLALQFDTVTIGRNAFPVHLSLRALAGFMEVQDAQTPEFSPGFGTPGPWITTRQIGGDEVYGVGGPVTNYYSERVGTAVHGGVLVHVRASQDSQCRGALDPEDTPQALWVFSADACGVYGLQHVRIAHAGKTDPTGVIVLISDAREVKLRAGDALLLRTLQRMF